MKTLLFLTLLAALACSQTLQKQKMESLMVTTCDTIITICPHGTFMVQLPAVISTGFSWSIATQSDPSLLLPPSDEIVTQISADDRDGRTEIQVIQLAAADKKGTTVLTLHYRRPFEKNKAPAKTCTITVMVH